MPKVMLFIDGPNLSHETKSYDENLEVDFRRLADALVAKVAPDAQYEGAYYYCSVVPGFGLRTPEDKERARKREGFLEALRYKRGYTVKKLIKAERLVRCAGCGNESKTFVEKGVDIALATDMMAQGVLGCYDIAILVSNDGDYAPAVDFLKTRGKKVYHAQFHPNDGRNLRRVCFDSIDLADLKDEIKR